MTKDLKKKIFFKILKSMFNDTFVDIKRHQDIQFYHFLIDNLEIEIFEIPQEDEACISLCFSMIELLSGFDSIHTKNNTWKTLETHQYLKDYAGLTNLEFNESMPKMLEKYKLIKEDFILRFS